MKILPADATVSVLIDEDTKQWNRDLIFRVFNPFEAQQIVNIPVSRRLPVDRLVWHFEKNGLYSVKSAYHLLKNDNSRNIAESSNSSNLPFWKAIWKIKAPNSVRNFIWRLARDILPTRSRLERKGIILDTQCPLCCKNSETSSHLFMHCDMAKLVWFSSPWESIYQVILIL